MGKKHFYFFDTLEKSLWNFAWLLDWNLTVVSNPPQWVVWGHSLRQKQVSGHRVISPFLSCGHSRWCVSVRCSGTKPLLWAEGDTNSVMQGDGCCVGPPSWKKQKNLEPVQLNYKEIWQGSLKGLLQRLASVTFIFSMPAVIAVISRQHETNLIAFGGIN